MRDFLDATIGSTNLVSLGVYVCALGAIVMCVIALVCQVMDAIAALPKKLRKRRELVVPPMPEPVDHVHTGWCNHGSCDEPTTTVTQHDALPFVPDSVVHKFRYPLSVDFSSDK